MLVVTCLGLLTPPGAQAQGQTPETVAANLAAPQAAGAGGSVARLVTALDLYAAGLVGPDALNLAVAARLVQGVDMRDSTGWTMTDAPLADPAPLPAIPADGALARLDLLASDTGMAGALMMAEEDPALADVLYGLPPVARGRPQGGVSEARAEVAAGQAQVWEMVFAGQSPAEVLVLAGAGPGLRWRVEDGAGQPVCGPHAAAEARLCAFTPAANGFFRVVVENPGDGPGLYALLTN